MCSVEKPIIIMSDKLLKIIEKKIDLFIQPSFVDLGFKISALIKPLKPVDLNKLSSIIDEFTSIIGQTINYHSEEIIKIIKTALMDSGIEVTKRLSNNILKINDSRNDKSKYLDRLPNFLEMIGRHYSRMGIRFDQSKYRIDIASSKYEAMVKTLVRRNSEKLKTEMDILCLSVSPKGPVEVSKKLTINDVNKAVDLKPNFFGIGLNLNYLISRVKQWWSNKKNT